MQLTPVAPGFYQIQNVLNQQLLDRLLQEFDDVAHWQVLRDTDKNATVRYQLGLQLNSGLAEQICQALLPVQVFAENAMHHELYQNSPQLWEDTVGYINEPHCDFSPNLAVNVQVYLSHSQAQNTGTGCWHNGVWYQVPYQHNSGYLMLNPTQLRHGMQHPVIDQRRSLYQSYRATVEASPVW